jgi:outer membrane biosynthesis protein TonB
MISMQDNPDIFGHAASDAVRQWKYNPYLVNGQPAAMRTTTTIKFEPPH